MYKVYSKPQAIIRVQNYLRNGENRADFVAPSGVYDSATQKAVQNFQKENLLPETGIVNKSTFDLLYLNYVEAKDEEETEKSTSGFIEFPILPGKSTRGMAHINRLLADLLSYYGFTHNIKNESNLYSRETERAVEILRKIYLLPPSDGIDWLFYRRLTLDHNSIYEFIID